MLLQPGYLDDAHVVHLTHTSIVHEALCGVTVVWHGAPDLSVVCDACLAEALAAHLDAGEWVRAGESEPLVLPIAA